MLPFNVTQPGLDPGANVTSLLFASAPLALVPV